MYRRVLEKSSNLWKALNAKIIEEAALIGDLIRRP
jgi:hypothetical protein